MGDWRLFAVRCAEVLLAPTECRGTLSPREASGGGEEAPLFMPDMRESEAAKGGWW